MFSSQYDFKKGLMVHTAQDGISVDDLLVANRNWFSHPEFQAGRPVLWNLNDCQLNMSMEEMRGIYYVVRDHLADQKRQGGRTGWVHPSALVRAMIDVTWSEFDWGSEWQTFEDMDAATRWCLGRV